MKKIILLLITTLLFSGCLSGEIRVTEPEVVMIGGDEVNYSLSLSDVLVTDFVHLYGYSADYGYLAPKCATSFEVPLKKDIPISRAGYLVNAGYVVHAFIGAEGYAGAEGDVLSVQWYHEKVEYLRDETGSPDLSTKSHLDWEKIGLATDRVIEASCDDTFYAYASIDADTVAKFHTPLSDVYRVVFRLNGQDVGVQQFKIIK